MFWHVDYRIYPMHCKHLKNSSFKHLLQFLAQNHSPGIDITLVYGGLQQCCDHWISNIAVIILALFMTIRCYDYYTESTSNTVSHTLTGSPVHYAPIL